MEPQPGVDPADTTPPGASAVGPLGLPIWTWWTLAAFVATFFHLLIDLHLGLFGPTSREMSVLKGFWGLSQGMLFGWWMLTTALALLGKGSALKSSLVLTGVVAFLLNGVVAFVVAPPISDAAPWQDLAHLGATLAGLLALRAGVAEYRGRGPAPGGRLLMVTVALLLANMALGAPLNLAALSS